MGDHRRSVCKLFLAILHHTVAESASCWTARLLGAPLPPFLKIDIEPTKLEVCK